MGPNSNIQIRTGKRAFLLLYSVHLTTFDCFFKKTSEGFCIPHRLGLQLIGAFN